MDRYEIDGYRSLQRKQHAARVQELRHERKTEEERLVVLKKSLQTSWMSIRSKANVKPLKENFSTQISTQASRRRG